MVSAMQPEHHTDEIVSLIRSLYPDASDEELRRAEQALGEYLAVVLRIFDRLEREKQTDSSNADAHDRV